MITFQNKKQKGAINMSEQNKFVGDTTLIRYDENIKNWFAEQIDSVPMMDLVYHEDERILEFVESVK